MALPQWPLSPPTFLYPELLRSLIPSKGVVPMTYSKIVFKNAAGEVLRTYTNVTNYTSHDLYVSFNGKLEGGDGELHDYEENRSGWSTVELIA